MEKRQLRYDGQIRGDLVYFTCENNRTTGYVNFDGDHEVTYCSGMKPDNSLVMTTKTFETLAELKSFIDEKDYAFSPIMESHIRGIL